MGYADLRVAIFTICANNYLAAAEVLFDSARIHHPEADLFLCVSDRRLDSPGCYGAERNVIFAEELSIQNFEEFAFRYDVMELSTAIKPFMFQRLLFVEQYDYVIYFDPDIEIFRPLTSVFDLLRNGSSLVVTPHMLHPCERPDEPNDFTIMRAGVFNLGFMAAARCDETESILGWWARRVRYYCINAQQQGIFVDQKFVDLMPAFAPSLRISQDATLNVAYWNLAERSFSQNEDCWLVDDQPLTFFHFSGYNPNQPKRLSKHTGRFSEIASGPLLRICESYGAKLLAKGYGSIPSGSYAFSTFASGTKLHHLIRKMFRECHTYWPDDPFETYEAFLHQPWPGASLATPGYVVTNFMKFLYDQLPYLHMRLNLQVAEHVRELVDWYVCRAATEWHLDLNLIQPAAQRMGLQRPSIRLDRARTPNRNLVSVVGYLRTASGVGEVARQTLRTLATSNLPVNGVDVELGVVAARNDSSLEDKLVESSSAPVQIFNINADQLPAVLSKLAGRLNGDGVRINIPFWELSQFPDAWVPALEQMSEIWAPSRFIQAAIAPKVSRPVIYMPVAIEIEKPPKVPRSYFSLPDDRFLYFYSFDFLSFMERKNPTAAVTAFRQAFSKGNNNVGLVVKCMNGSLVAERFREFEEFIRDDPNIYLLKDTFTRSDTLTLVDCIDAVVSLHRSEGLGLLIAEAMLLEKPVIATDYAATREFVSTSTGYPVDYRLTPVLEGQYPFPQNQVWADPDIGHCAWHMRRIYEDPHGARLKALSAAQHMQNFSRERVCRMQEARLAKLLNS